MDATSAAQVGTEVVTMGVIAVSAVWVYLDATKNEIGKIPGSKGVFNMSAGGWGAATLFLWIVGFPAYLVKREKLIAKARTSPVVVKGRMVKAAVLAIAGALAGLMTVLPVPPV